MRIECESIQYEDSFAKGKITSIKLETVIDKVSQEVNKRLMEMIFGKYKFFEHCYALKRYLLLGQGDFIEYLMDLLVYKFVIKKDIY